MEASTKSKIDSYKDLANNIDMISMKETFYQLSKEDISCILRNTKSMKAETTKRIIEELWKNYGDECFNFLFDINFNISNENSIGDTMRFVLGPLINLKMFGRSIFRDLADYYDLLSIEKESSNDCLSSEGFVIQSDPETVKKSLSIKNDHNTNAKIIEEICKNKCIDFIMSSNPLSEQEIVNMYLDDEKDKRECLTILKDIQDGNTKIDERDGYCSGRNYPMGFKKNNDPLLVVAKKAIDACDISSLIVILKGCFLHSNCGIQDDFGNLYSLFEYACDVNSVFCALQLLNSGGGINQRFVDGETPLFEALRTGNETISMHLIDKGSDINAVDDYKNTMLHAAAIGNCALIAEMLIAGGLDIKSKNTDGSTPLHSAASGNSTDMARLLLDHKSNIESRDNEGRTPLHIALTTFSIDTAKLLIEKGANIKAKDHYGATPHQIIASWDDEETAKYVLEK